MKKNNSAKEKKLSQILASRQHITKIINDTTMSHYQIYTNF
jgi:hypothetical protein